MRLGSWAKIARYLRVSPRTARRWRDEWGLPVERVNAVRVRTTTTEIDNWLLALDKAQRELGWTGLVKLRADRHRIVERALDKLWDAKKQAAA